MVSKRKLEKRLEALEYELSDMRLILGVKRHKYGFSDNLTRLECMAITSFDQIYKYLGVELVPNSAVEAHLRKVDKEDV